MSVSTMPSSAGYLLIGVAEDTVVDVLGITPYEESRRYVMYVRVTTDSDTVCLGKL